MGAILDAVAPQQGQASPIDRFAPLMGAAASGLSTPSAGGAGPIIGNVLGGYMQGRQAELAADAARQRAQRLYELQKSKLEEVKQQHKTAYQLSRERMGLQRQNAQERVRMDKERVKADQERARHNVATENRPQLGTTPEERRQVQERKAVDTTLRQSLQAYEKYVPKDLVTGARSVDPVTWFSTDPLGKSTLQFFARQNGAPMDYVADNMRTITVPPQGGTPASNAPPTPSATPGPVALKPGWDFIPAP